ncbi:MAG TPA: response regulator, partial [Thermodesulfobacteriaceae bacterium]|nr:response regulator [Thermodesulfobacteriaceae bacterium]
MPTQRPEILIVDDDPSFREFLSLFLKKEGYQVLVSQNGKEALTILKRKRPHLI